MSFLAFLYPHLWDTHLKHFSVSVVCRHSTVKKWVLHCPHYAHKLDLKAGEDGSLGDIQENGEED